MSSSTTSTEQTPLLSNFFQNPPSQTRLKLLTPLILILPLTLYLFHQPPHLNYLAHPGVQSSSPHHLPTPYVPLSFLALGDWGRHGQFGQRRVAKALANTVSRTLSKTGYNPHYILSTGDNFYKTGVSSISDPHFTTSFQNVYNHTILSNLPWYVILGNHDHIGSISAQVSFTSQNPRWNMPATYFAQRFADNLVAIFLDTTPFLNTDDGKIAREKNKQSPQAQLRWLKRQLADTPPNAYFLILGHHNLYTMSIAGHYGSAELREQVEPLLVPYRDRILAYISGHEHALMHMQPYARQDPDNAAVGAPFSPVVDHFISGAGSKLDRIVVPQPDEVQKYKECCGVLPLTDDQDIARTVWGKSVHGFFSFRFDGKLFTADAVDDAGNVVYSYNKTVS